MKFLPIILLIAFLGTSCSTYWEQSPAETLKDGSDIRITEWHRQLKKDGVRVDRTTRTGQKSYYYLKRTPADYDKCEILSQSRTGVTLRFSDDTRKVVFDREFPYSEFVSTKD